LVVEDLKRGTNKDIGPKDIFEMPHKVVSKSQIRIKGKAQADRESAAYA